MPRAWRSLADGVSEGASASSCSSSDRSSDSESGAGSSRERPSVRLLSALAAATVAAAIGVTTLRPALSGISSRAALAQPGPKETSDRELWLRGLLQEGFEKRAEGDGFEDLDEAMSALAADGDGRAAVLGGAPNATLREAMEENLRRAQAESRMEGGAEAAEIARIHDLMETEVAGKNMTETEPEMIIEMDRHRPKEKGAVGELYTFGSPGTARVPLYDPLRPDGCFEGLRTYTSSTRFSPLGVPFKITDVVASITAAFAYKHPYQESYEASAVSTKRKMGNCTAYNRNIPKWDNFLWTAGHQMYPVVLRGHVRDDSVLKSSGLLGGVSASQKISKAALFSKFSEMNYALTQQIAVDAGETGWTFAARVCSWGSEDSEDFVSKSLLDLDNGTADESAAGLESELDSLVAGCENNAILYQQPETLECVVVFQGSTVFLDWLANFDIQPWNFCGFGKVHKGFRAKMLRMTAGMDWRQVMLPKLKKCSSVAATGHSLGGAIAELWSSCVNKAIKPGESGYAEHRIVSFEFDKPEKLPSFYSDHAEGNFFQNRGTGLCLDVRGTASTNTKSDVIVFNCETPGERFPGEQLWNITENGNVVNKLTGKCLESDPARIRGRHLVLWDCDEPSPTSSQSFQLTEDGLLQSKRNTRHCVTALQNAKLGLFNCPRTDQHWSVNTDGTIVNMLSGNCLTTKTKGDKPPGHGSQLALGRCNTAAEGYEQDARWSLDGEGPIRHQATGLCVVVKIANVGITRDLRPHLVLGECGWTKQEVRVTFAETGGGFITATRLGFCLDVEGNPGIAPGSEVRLAPCQVSPAPKTRGLWMLRGDGYLVNIGNRWHEQYKCVDIFEPGSLNRSVANGMPIWSDYCKLNSDQKWELTSDGFLKNVIGGRKCLGARRQSPPNPNVLEIQNCKEPSNPSLFLDFKWRLDSFHQQNAFYEECLDVFGNPGTEDGTDLDLWVCESGNHSDQRWEFYGNKSEHVKNILSGKCLDIDRDGRHLEIQPCEESKASQVWHQTKDGIWRSGAFHDKCAAVKEEHKLVNSRIIKVKAVVLLTCPFITQQWDLTSEGVLQNRLLKTCVEAQMNGTAGALPWWALRMAPCNKDSDMQKWQRLPAGAMESVATE